jgi:hypothetical protein
VYKLLCIFSPLFTTVRPEDGQARPKHLVTFDNKIQNQDGCVFRQTPPPSFDVHKHNGDDQPEKQIIHILCGQNIISPKTTYIILSTRFIAVSLHVLLSKFGIFIIMEAFCKLDIHVAGHDSILH